MYRRGGVKLDHLGHADSVRWRLTVGAAGIAERIPIYRSWVLSKLVVERVMARLLSLSRWLSPFISRM